MTPSLMPARSSGGADCADKGDTHFRRRVVEVDKDAFAGLKADGVGDKLAGKLIETGIVHGFGGVRLKVKMGARWRAHRTRGAQILNLKS